MGILSRYLYKVLGSSCLLGFLFYLSLFLIQAFFEIIELSLRQGIPFLKASWIIALSLPSMTAFTLPMAMLFGVLLAMARLLHAGEVRALLTLGIPRTFLLKHILFFSSIITLFVGAIWLYGVPLSLHALTRYRINLVKNAFIQQIAPQQFMKQFSPYILYVQHMDETKLHWKNILILDFSLQGYERFITAQRGNLRIDEKKSTLWLDLENITSHIYRPSYKENAKYQIQRSDSHTLKLFSPAEHHLELLKNEPQYLTLLQLMKKHDRKALLELHKRLSLTFTVLVFAFLGLALALRRIDMHSTSAFIWSLFVILGDYTLISLMQNWAMTGALSPALAMWTPPTILGILAIIYWFTAKERVAKPSLAKRILTFFHLWIAERRSRSTLELTRFPTYLDFYLWTGFLKILFFILLAISIIYVVVDFSQLADEVQKHHVSLLFVANYYLMRLPQMLYEQGIPLGLMLAVALHLTLMERHGELTVLRSSGISLYRVTIPFLSVVGVLTVMFFLFAETALPYLNQKANLYRQVIYGKPVKQVLPLSPFRRQLILAGGDHLYQIGLSDRTKKILYDVQVLGWDKDTFSPNRHVYTRKMVWQNARWIMLDGWERIIDGSRIISFRTFNRRDLPYLESLQDLIAVSFKPQEMGIAKYYEFIKNLKASGWQQPLWQVQFWIKVFQPLVFLVLTFFAFALSLRFLSPSTMKSIGLVLLAGLLYWAVFALFTNLGELQVFPAALAVVTPLVFFTLIGAWFILEVKI